MFLSRSAAKAASASAAPLRHADVTGESSRMVAGQLPANLARTFVSQPAVLLWRSLPHCRTADLAATHCCEVVVSGLNLRYHNPGTYYGRNTPGGTGTLGSASMLSTSTYRVRAT